MHYTQEQIDRANAVSLEDFLRSQGETLIRSGHEFRWKQHDSLTIRDNKWFRHSQSKGGFPVDFVMEFYGKSFPEAVAMLLGDTGYLPEKDEPQFRLPPRRPTNDAAYRYLSEKRMIASSLLDVFFKAGDIYEDAAHRNVVFVGRDKNDIPRYAHTRGIEDQSRRDVSGSDKSCGFCYHGSGNQLFVFEAPIDLLSFICLYSDKWTQRSYVSLGGVSGKALDRFLSENKDIGKVFLCTDNDEAGNTAAMRLAQTVPDGIEAVRFSPMMKDWNEVLCHAEQFPNKRYHAENVVLKESIVEKPVPVIRMSEVVSTNVEWLWKPYIPFGKVSILQGNPGEGKTYFAMQLAAACTGRKPLPGMDVIEPFNMIYQTAEDGLGDTIRPRLEKAGADLERILVIDDGDKPLTLTDERLEKAIRENSARLVIIDPIQAFLGADVDMNRANEVRPVFRKLGDIAQDNRAAILLIGHLNKANGMSSLQRGLGSTDIIAAVRSALFIGKLKDDPTIRVLTHEKSSLAPAGDSIAFTLGDEDGFSWIGAVEITADQLLSGAKEVTPKATKVEQGVKLLEEMLRDGAKASNRDILARAKSLGISRRTLNDSKARLGERLKSEPSADGSCIYSLIM